MLLLIEKPSGPTSFDLVKKIKRIHRNTPRVKVGHAGTLDPLASGLMIIGIGKSTKRLHGLTGLDKTYEATIDFSQWSDTWDTDCDSRQAPVSNNKKDQILAKKRGWSSFEQIIPSVEQLEKECISMIGNNDYLLTPFSAKKVDGKKLYQYARAGSPVFKTVPMKVYNVELLHYEFPTVKIHFEVGSGTYIRSLAQTLGNRFGWGGIITQLKRISVGPFSLDQLQ